VVAAEDVSFCIRRGEALALVGESGSGKSTVARLVLRLETADSGQIFLDGEDVLAREPRRASLGYRGRVQMVFQDPFGSLNPVHDVEHHLVRPLLRHRRVRPKEARARAIELLRTVGLEPAEDFIDRHPYELSGGQRQRVAIARALAGRPGLVLADEPTAHLDPRHAQQGLDLLLAFAAECGAAVLVVTHDAAVLARIPDHLELRSNGATETV
jgi:ABC-type glutathione transport system ATPase component